MALTVSSPGGFIQTFTWSTKPATYPVGQKVFISDAGVKGSHWWYDGTRWKPVNGVVVLAALDTILTGVTTVAQIALQYQMPPGLWQTGDRIEFRGTGNKSGTTDTGALRFYAGPLGTTGDVNLYNQTFMAAANRVASALTDFRLASATSIQQLGASGSGSSTVGYSSIAGVAMAGAVTVTSVAANSTFLSCAIASSSTNDTVGMADAQFTLRASPN